MKYIVFAKDMPHGMKHEVPVIFPEHLVHKDVSRCMLIGEGLRGYKAVRAGFCDLAATVTAGGISKQFPMVTHGKSETLNLESDPGDAMLLTMYGYTGGMS